MNGITALALLIICACIFTIAIRCFEKTVFMMAKKRGAQNARMVGNAT